MRRAGHQRAMARLRDRLDDALVVGSYRHAASAARARPLADMHHHRFAAQVRERLAGKSRRRIARRDDYVESQATSSSGGSLRASSSSITGMPSLIGKPRRSALQTSSSAGWRCSSGPLQIGQTRISSSFGSTQLLQQPALKRGIERRAHREYPVVRLGKALAFYRVLFSHHERRGIAELKVAGDERMVIRERMRHRLHAEARQVEEETLRIAD